MKALIQRVSESFVTVEGNIVGKIGKGILLFLAVEKGDAQSDIDYLVKKVANLRIFYDSEHRMNLSLKDVNGSILIISQFTLSADCRKGNRPSFDRAESPGRSNELYEVFIENLKATGVLVETGKFAAYMEVSLVNDGPVTFLIDSKK